MTNDSSDNMTNIFTKIYYVFAMSVSFLIIMICVTLMLFSLSRNIVFVKYIYREDLIRFDIEGKKTEKEVFLEIKKYQVISSLINNMPFLLVSIISFILHFFLLKRDSRGDKMKESLHSP